MWASRIIFCVQRYDIKGKWVERSKETFISYSLSAKIPKSSTTCCFSLLPDEITKKDRQCHHNSANYIYIRHSFTVLTLCNI